MAQRTPIFYWLQNAQGMRACISNYGARLVALWVPDREGVMENVVLGYDTHAAYLNDSYYMGCVVGRLANRVGNASFLLPDVAGCKPVQLDANHGPHQLHGGAEGFHSQYWDAMEEESCCTCAIEDEALQRRFIKAAEADVSGDSVYFGTAPVTDLVDECVTLQYHSPDGEAGYPAALDVTVRYSLTNDGALRVEFRAVPDAPTVVDMTHHAYFNLSGFAGDKDCLNHSLQLEAAQMVVVDRAGVATGELASVADSPLDFRSPALLQDRVDADHPAIQQARGIDHYFVVNCAVSALRSCGQLRSGCNAGKDCGKALKKVAVLAHSASGRMLTVYSTASGLQVYTANYVEEGTSGAHDAPYGPRAGICLETHGYPNAPNMPHFPSVTATADAPFCMETEFRFSTLPHFDRGRESLVVDGQTEA